MRLVTRSDFDGLVCGALLKEAGIIDTWMFAHPKDLQDGLVEINENDCLANVPYVEGCGLWFDLRLINLRVAPTLTKIQLCRRGNMQKFKQRDILRQPALQICLFHIHTAHFKGGLPRLFGSDMRIGKMADILPVSGILNISCEISTA